MNIVSTMGMGHNSVTGMICRLIIIRVCRLIVRYRLQTLSSHITHVHLHVVLTNMHLTFTSHYY